MVKFEGRGYDGLGMWLEWGDIECVQNFSREDSWKTSTSKPEKYMGG
jgi:hypothetical protein